MTGEKRETGPDQPLLPPGVEPSVWHANVKAAARRALAEAAARRQAAAAGGKKTGRHARPREIGGPDGPEPTRFGDWERAGIVTDF